MAELDGTLDWPPEGSPDDATMEPESAELLSANMVGEGHDDSAPEAK